MEILSYLYKRTGKITSCLSNVSDVRFVLEKSGCKRVKEQVKMHQGKSR